MSDNCESTIQMIYYTSQCN